MVDCLPGGIVIIVKGNVVFLIKNIDPHCTVPVEYRSVFESNLNLQNNHVHFLTVQLWYSRPHNVSVKLR